MESGQTAETALLPGFAFRRVARFILPRAVWLAGAWTAPLPMSVRTRFLLACGRGDRAPPHVRTDAVPVGLRARGPRPYAPLYGRGFRVLFGLRFPRPIWLAGAGTAPLPMSVRMRFPRAVWLAGAGTAPLRASVRTRFPRPVWLAVSASYLDCGHGDRAPPHVRTDAVPASCLACGSLVLFGLWARGPCPSPCPYGRGSRVLFSSRLRFPRPVWLAVLSFCLACGRGDRAPTHARTDAVPIGLRARGPRPSPCPYGRGSRVLFGLRFPRAVS